ncbi:MAG TPA: hypothetical protein PK530_09110 [Anaerolineales bacterium]|nr:hypothetical protein [Anaerolineales bacterium]
MNNRPGCLSGLLKLFIFDQIFDFLQDRFGFGRGLSCGGCGCGLIIMILSVAVTCYVILGTNWTSFSF